MDANRRQFFRVHYTEGDAPSLLFQGKKFTVVNVSEGGFEFLLGGTRGVTLQMAVHGALLFSGGESVLVLGTVQRMDGDHISVKLSSPIPLHRIMEEQRRQIEKFPNKKAQP